MFLWSAWDLKIWYSVIYQQRNLNCAVVFLSCSMMFLLLVRVFTQAQILHFFDWTPVPLYEAEFMNWGVFSQFFKLSSIYPVHIIAVGIIGGKKDHSTAFSMCQSDLVSLKARISKSQLVVETAQESCTARSGTCREMMEHKEHFGWAGISESAAICWGLWKSTCGALLWLSMWN